MKIYKYFKSFLANYINNLIKRRTKEGRGI